jgi:hypothetical protein
LDIGVWMFRTFLFNWFHFVSPWLEFMFQLSKTPETPAIKV